MRLRDPTTFLRHEQKEIKRKFLNKKAPFIIYTLNTVVNCKTWAAGKYENKKYHSTIINDMMLYVFALFKLEN